MKKAEADYRGAVRLAGGTESFHDLVCFHSQQAAEKYLKGLLDELGLPVPKTHNLDDLLALLLPHHAGLQRFQRSLIFLTDFAVQTRYIEDWATKRQASSALRRATEVRGACRALLGLRQRKPRKRKSR